ncbi:MAG: hypothetical protein ACSLEG_00115 [Candidatus Carsonella ruddii]
MKNLFLLKKIIFFFSFGKDSFFNYKNIFYKKKILLFINYNKKKNNKFNFLFFKKKFYFIVFKKFTNNENYLRKTRFFIKKNNLIFFKNHHYLDKIEFLIIKILKKNFYLNLKNLWFKNKIYNIKPFINLFIFKNLKIEDKTNKNILLNRNFIRCLIGKFL